MDLPAGVWLIIAGAGFALALLGARGAMAIHAAVSTGDLASLNSPPQWPAVRALAGFLCALVVVMLGDALGSGRWFAALAAGGLGYATLPAILSSVRRRIEGEVLDDLPLHLDLVALALEGGSTLSGALALSAEHVPPGALRRALAVAIVDIQAGVEPGEALRDLEERLDLRIFGNLIPSLRSAEKFGMPLALVVRDKARQAAANRFARAERRARAVPLKLWATLVLCLAPCTLFVLAFPLAAALARIAG